MSRWRVRWRVGQRSAAVYVFADDELTARVRAEQIVRGMTGALRIDITDVKELPEDAGAVGRVRR